MSIVTWEGEYNKRQVRAEIEVVQAEGLEAIARTLLLIELEANPPPKDASLREMARYSLRYVHADCVGSARSGFMEIDGEKHEANDLPFSIFENIPFPLLFAWEQETYRCNPDWLPEAQAAKKKALPSSSRASKSSTKRRTRTTTASPSTST